MNTLHSHTTGLALGSFFAVVHLLWALLVAAGWAQWTLDWIFRLHFITPPYTVGSFSLMLAIGLIVMTFIVGYVLGWVFAMIWNKVHVA
jgi:ABC-type Fe3+ transport system permease subunit